jgi:LysR family transcriptional regulator (chromosome initiation inhibitor)
MLDYAALAAVAAVVREGSFDRAADVLGVTASAVSQRVRALEERLGVVLVNRGQPCTATPPGARLCAHVERVRLLEERLGVVLVNRGQPCTATPPGARLCAHVERVRLLEGEMAVDLPALVGERRANGPVTVRIAVNSDSLGTWFPPAVAAFAQRTGALVDLVLDGEDQTAERLRTGEVLAAVTAQAIPVQGCRTTPLGALRYVATASPAFVKRYFPNGLTAEALRNTPVLRFDRKDRLQARWMLENFAVALAAPIHWIPSTQGFVDGVLTGLGWGMNPLSLVAPHLAAGRLIELRAGAPLDVPLYWQQARLGAGLLDALAREVRTAAERGLVARREPE